MIPLTLGSLYAWYRFETFHVENFLLMLVSLLCVDMATTVINNYQDYKRATKKHGYGYEIHNSIVKNKLTAATVRTVIFVLLAIAVTSGVLLYLNTDVIVLLLGLLSFLIGVGYSFGPLPIYRTPLGEIMSGLTLGLGAPFLAIYIHVFERGIITLHLENAQLLFGVDIVEIGMIILLALPAVMAITNIMLANNICDMEEDFENKRYTLPISIGKEKALRLFRRLYDIGFVAIAIAVALQILPLISIAVLGTYGKVRQNVAKFTALQTKKDTFVVAVKNFVLINGVYVLTLALAVILRFFFR